MTTLGEVGRSVNSCIGCVKSKCFIPVFEEKGIKGMNEIEGRKHILASKGIIVAGDQKCQHGSHD